MKTIAKIASVMFHPLLMPSYLLIIIFSGYTYLSFNFEPHRKLYLVLFVFLYIFLTPGFVTLILMRFKQVQSLSLRTRRERFYPYLISIIMTGIVLFSFTKNQIAPLITLLFIGILASLITLFIINFFWKISAHMAGIGGVIGALIALQIRLNSDMSGYVILAILVAGIIGSARLALGAHKPAQLLVGLIVGIIPQIYILLF